MKWLRILKTERTPAATCWLAPTAFVLQFAARRAPHAKDHECWCCGDLRTCSHACRDRPATPPKPWATSLRSRWIPTRCSSGWVSVQISGARPITPAQTIAGIELQQRDDYLVTIVGGRPEFFPGKPGELEKRAERAAAIDRCRDNHRLARARPARSCVAETPARFSWWRCTPVSPAR